MNSSGFDRIAWLYPGMEWVLAGTILQEARVEYLGGRRGPARVLLVGEGHGRFLCECRVRWPEAELTVVEASAGMVKEARKRLRRKGVSEDGIRWVVTSLQDWLVTVDEAVKFDVVVTHFFLDCFEGDELQCCVKGLSRLLERKGEWWMADFQIPEGRGMGKWRSVRAKWIHACMYWFFRRVTRLPARRWQDPAPLLEAEGFRLRARRTLEWELVRSDHWQRGN